MLLALAGDSVWWDKEISILKLVPYLNFHQLQSYFHIVMVCGTNFYPKNLELQQFVCANSKNQNIHTSA